MDHNYTGTDTDMGVGTGRGTETDMDIRENNAAGHLAKPATDPKMPVYNPNAPHSILLGEVEAPTQLRSGFRASGGMVRGPGVTG